MNNTNTLKVAILTSGIILTATSLHAAVSYTGSAISQDFTGYTGASALTDWDASGFSSGSGFSENRGSSTGGVSTGGSYAFDLGGGNMALGVQAGGSDFTPGYYQLQVTNNSGVSVDSWSVAFKSFVYNDQGRSNSFNFSYSTDGSTFTDVAAGSFTSAADADTAPSWQLGVDFNQAISASVANGDSLYLRWTGDDVGGAGSRDEFALDDLTLNSVPEPSSSALLGCGSLVLLLRRKR